MPTVGSQYAQAHPRTPFFKSIGGLSPFLRRYFETQLNPIYGEYLGSLGDSPFRDFGTFLRNYDFMNRFYGIAPRQRGVYQSTYAPPTRFLPHF